MIPISDIGVSSMFSPIFFRSVKLTHTMLAVMRANVLYLFRWVSIDRNAANLTVWNAGFLTASYVISTCKARNTFQNMGNSSIDTSYTLLACICRLGIWPSCVLVCIFRVECESPTPFNTGALMSQNFYSSRVSTHVFCISLLYSYSQGEVRLLTGLYYVFFF